MKRTRRAVFTEAPHGECLTCSDCDRQVATLADGRCFSCWRDWDDGLREDADEARAEGRS